MNVVAVGAAICAGLWAGIRHIQLPRGPSRMHWAGKVFGHRGCRNIKGIPENTLQALEYACLRGASGIEIDVRLSKDGVLVVHHDAFLGEHFKNVTNPLTRVDELDLHELRRLQYTCDPTNTVKMATLEECVLFCRDKDIKMLIEIKELVRLRECVERLRELYQQYPDFLYESSAVIAFSPMAVYRVRKADQRIAVCQLTCNDLMRTWASSRAEATPRFVTLAPALWDFLLVVIQLRLVPWLAGVSMVGPHFAMMSDEQRRIWTTRGILIYRWGYTNPAECTTSMRTKDLIAVDDAYSDFLEPKRPNFAVFTGDNIDGQPQRPAPLTS